MKFIESMANIDEKTIAACKAVIDSCESISVVDPCESSAKVLDCLSKNIRHREVQK